MRLLSWLQDPAHDTETTTLPEPHPSPILAARMRELSRISVLDVMTPRTVVLALDVDVQLKRVRRLKSAKAQYFPVYKGDLDQILGWIAKSKVLELVADTSEEANTVKSWLRPVGMVSETAHADELADLFLKSQSPFLVVKNSEGATLGLVELNEFVELLFGFSLESTPTISAIEFAVPLLRGHDL